MSPKLGSSEAPPSPGGSVHSRSTRPGAAGAANEPTSSRESPAIPVIRTEPLSRVPVSLWVMAVCYSHRRPRTPGPRGHLCLSSRGLLPGPGAGQSSGSGARAQRTGGWFCRFSLRLLRLQRGRRQSASSGAVLPLGDVPMTRHFPPSGQGRRPEERVWELGPRSGAGAGRSLCFVLCVRGHGSAACPAGWC